MPHFETFHLPDAGEGLTEAEIVAWHVAVGDTVAINQPLLEIETAKSLVELPCPYAGVVTEILANPGDTVDVGAPIIVVDTDPHGPPAPDDAPAAQGNAVSSPDAGAAASATEATAAQPAGTRSAQDDVPSVVSIAEPAEESGGAVLVGYGTSAPATTRRRAAGTAPAPTPAQPAAPEQARHASSKVFAKPPVRRLAKDLGIDLSAVTPTGPGGIITREDVVAHHADAQPQLLATYPGDDQPWLESGTVSNDGRQTRVPVKSVRKRTAEAMVSSAFSAPHVTVFHTVDVTRTMRLVARLREDREFADVRVTPLLITAKALLLAVRRQPEINASWDEESQEIVYKHYVNLGIAAATPRGLVVPNIKDSHRLDLKGLAHGIAELTATARSGRVTPADMSDGTITITNVGVFGIDSGTPILNPGEAAILAFGAIREQPWVHKGKIRKRHVSQLALSFDHRLVDGALGSRVLADVAKVLEDPGQALVWG